VVAPIAGTAAAAADSLAPDKKPSSDVIDIGNHHTDDSEGSHSSEGQEQEDSGQINQEEGRDTEDSWEPDSHGEDHSGQSSSEGNPGINGNERQPSFPSGHQEPEGGVESSGDGFSADRPSGIGDHGADTPSITPENSPSIGDSPPSIGSDVPNIENHAESGFGSFPESSEQSVPEPSFAGQSDFGTAASGGESFSSVSDVSSASSEAMGSISNAVEAVASSPIGAVANTYLTFGIDPSGLYLPEMLSGLQHVLMLLSVKTVTIWLPAGILAGICIVSTSFNFVRLLKGENSIRKEKKK
jgi:hypothetical protein